MKMTTTRKTERERTTGLAGEWDELVTIERNGIPYLGSGKSSDTDAVAVARVARFYGLTEAILVDRQRIARAEKKLDKTAPIYYIGVVMREGLSSRGKKGDSDEHHRSSREHDPD